MGRFGKLCKIFSTAPVLKTVHLHVGFNVNFILCLNCGCFVIFLIFGLYIHVYNQPCVKIVLLIHSAAGVDFDESPTVVTLSSNEMQGCASLAIMDDDVVEFEEMFTVSLSLFKESRVHISNESVIVNIKDDDGTCHILNEQ